MREKYKIVCCGLFLVVICIPLFSGAIEKKLGDTEHISSPPLNNPPNKPLIEGPIIGETREIYTYKFKVTDPDDDDLVLHIDWGNSLRNFTMHSGQTVTTEHIWYEDGIYVVRARAIDIYGLESEWTSLRVLMPKNKAITMDSFCHYFLEFLQARFLWFIPS